MTKELLNQLNDILTNNRGNLFDFIIDNYYLLSKDELKDFAKEVVALLYEKAEEENIKNGKPYDRYDKLHKEILKNIKDNTTLLEVDE